MRLIGRVVGSLSRLVSAPAFVVDFDSGIARVRRGDVPAGLLVGLSDVARDVGLAHGTLYGVRRNHGLTLDFSADIPEHAHQRLRNVLALHRHQIKGG